MISSKKIVKVVDGKLNLYSYSEKKSSERYKTIFGNDIVFVNEIPEDEDYKDSWELSGSTISINMIKAKEIHRELLRNERNQCFEICDKLYTEAHSQDKQLNTIKARQQYLRDLPSDPTIDATTTITELKAITVTSWTPPIVKDLPSV